jgi:hypothetical protein
MKSIFYVGASIVVLIALVIGLRIVCFPVNTIGKSMDMTEEIRDKTLKSGNAIYNYEWFKQQSEDIKALYSKEARAKKELDDFRDMLPPDRSAWGRDDKIEYDRLNSIHIGLGNRTDDALALYNARAQMVNRNIFKDNLPTNLTRSWVTSFTYLRGE